jgi:hypothetical protein
MFPPFTSEILVLPLILFRINGWCETSSIRNSYFRKVIFLGPKKIETIFKSTVDFGHIDTFREKSTILVSGRPSIGHWEHFKLYTRSDLHSTVLANMHIECLWSEEGPINWRKCLAFSEIRYVCSSPKNISSKILFGHRGRSKGEGEGKMSWLLHA